MSRGKVFQCEITVSPGVKEKLYGRHDIEVWEIEEVIYDDLYAFSISHKDCYFVYGQTFSGRYLLVLVRVLSSNGVIKLGFKSGENVINIITARDMNKKQGQFYNKRRGMKR